MATFLRSIRPVASRFTTTPLPRLLFRPNSTTTASSEPIYEHIILSHPRPGVSLITLNRPKAYNALSTPLFNDLNSALRHLCVLPTTRCIVLTGSHKFFAAGADIKEMSNLDFSSAYGSDFIKLWSEQINNTPKPIIAAVNGFALGGGCELAMMADIIYAGPTATFGQPEVKLGIIPGAGGSQRLLRAIGKSRAMEMILTGKTISAQEAADWGLVARVFESPEKCVEEALNTAETIAGYGALAVKAAKEVVNAAEELNLAEGVKFERRVFHGLFATKDQKVGMKAFVEKTKPEWTHE
ncbi:ClpP/crotonase-like domain-containing protein [Kalaharituber pfeilii]|nr:ClpP/crotonase-like domain-containing protein [Kalaharituber pfeilii]